MKFIRKHILRSELLKNVTTLISGTAIAQLVAIAIQPLIRRLFTPEDFGAFALYLSIVSIVVVFVSFRYEQAIVLPESDDDAKNITVFSLSMALVVSVLLLILIFVFKDQIALLLNFSSAYAGWIYLLPASFFLLGIYQSMNYWLIRKKAFKASAINKVGRRASEGIAQSGFGVMKYFSGLPVGDIIGNAINCMSGIYQIRRRGFNLKNVSIENALKQAKTYNEFPKYNMIPALLNTFSLTMPVFIVNEIFTKELTGYFDLTRLVLALPLSLITASFSQVIYQYISEKKNKSLPILNDMYNQGLLLLVLSLIGIIIVYFWGPVLFSFIFGEEWEMSGMMARILVFSFAIKFVVSPFSTVLIALEKIRIVSVWQVIYFMVIASLFLIKNIDIYTLLRLLVLIDLISYGVYAVIIYYFSVGYEKGYSSQNDQN